MLATMAAALALAGAPAGTSVACVPGLERTAYGLATAFSGGPVDIELASPVCGGMLLLQASATEQATIRRLNPGLDVTSMEGDAALATLHEATHIALRSTDETVVECRAMSLLPSFLSRYLSAVALRNAEAAANEYDRSMPAPYHVHPCV